MRIPLSDAMDERIELTADKLDLSASSSSSSGNRYAVELRFHARVDPQVLT